MSVKIARFKPSCITEGADSLMNYATSSDRFQGIVPVRAEDIKRARNTTLRVNEIFLSIQGEGTYAGQPCVFIRLAGCNLRCSYCDTKYAQSAKQSKKMNMIEVADAVYSLLPNEIDKQSFHIEFTGGEPLLQRKGIFTFLSLYGNVFTTLIETNGSLPLIEREYPNHHLQYVMDIKCPSSGMSEKMRVENLEELREFDQIKFVVGSEHDFKWTLAWVDKIRSASPFGPDHTPVILYSPVFGQIAPSRLVELMLEQFKSFCGRERGIRARLSLQIHKLIWDPKKRGV